MSAAGIRAGKAYVELGATDNKLNAVLARVQTRMRAFGLFMAGIGGGLTGIGSGIVAPLLMMANGAASSGDELSKMADRTGASVEALSELRHAAKQSDVAFDQLGSGLNKLQKNLAGRDDIFAALGLDIDRLLAMEPDQQFTAIAEAISRIPDPAARTAAAMEVFGKSGANLMPLMLGGAAGIEALRAEARRLGLQVSGPDAQAATLFGDTWSNFLTVVADVRNEIGNALLPTLTGMLEMIIPIVVTAARWISENRSLIVTIFSIATGLSLVGGAILALGSATAALSFAIGGVITLVSGFATILAFAISPLGLVMGLIIGLGAAFLYFSGTADEVFAWLGESFSWLYEEASRTIGAIGTALQRGDISAAADILWLTLKAAWLAGTHSLSKIWLDLKHGMISIWFEIEKHLSKGFARVAATWKSLQNEITKKSEHVGINFGELMARQAAAAEIKQKGAEIKADLAAGRITPEEAEKRKEAAKKVFVDQLMYAQSSANTVRADTDANYKTKADDIARELEDSVAAIDADNQAQQDANAQAYAQAQSDVDAELAAAEAKRQAALAEEAVKSEEFNKKRSNSKPPEAKKLDEALSSISAGMGNFKSGGAFGTFSAAQVAQNFGSGTLQQKMVDHLATIAVNTGKNTPLVVKS